MRRLALTTGLTSLGKWGFAVTLGVYAFQQGGARAVGLVALAQACRRCCSRRSWRSSGSAVRAATSCSWQTSSAARSSSRRRWRWPPTCRSRCSQRAARLRRHDRLPRRLRPGRTAARGDLGPGGDGGCGAAYLLAVLVIARIPADSRMRRTPHRGALTGPLTAARAVRGDGGLRAALGLIGVLALTDGLTNVLIVVVAIDLVDRDRRAGQPRRGPRACQPPARRTTRRGRPGCTSPDRPRRGADALGVAARRFDCPRRDCPRRVAARA